MSDRHWSELPTEQPPAESVTPTPPEALPALGVVAQRLADVSPAWAAVTIPAATAVADDPGSAQLGRDRTQGVQAIREGWLLHRGASRVANAASPDLGLLMGDWCYAAGLCTITDHGSLDDVAMLAKLVADISARADEPVSALEHRWTETIEALTHG